MAREQGDDLGDEVTYTHPEHPEWGERPAHSPTDVVNLEARGWARQEKSKSGSSRRRAQDEGGADAAPTASN